MIKVSGGRIERKLVEIILFSCYYLGMKKKKILVIGDQCEDSYIFGSCQKLSPEAPVIDFKPRDYTRSAGMAANVFNNLVALSPDDWEIIPIFNKEKIAKTRYIDEASKQHLLRVSDEGLIVPLTISDLAKYQYDEDLIGIAISDYAKGFITEQLVIDILDKCPNIPIFIDTKKALGEWSRDIDFVKINNKEYEATKSTADCCVNLIVTQGEKGSWWVNKDIHVATEPVALADFCGAGDTYFAAFIAKYLKEYDIQGAMSYANKAARLAVSRRGVAVIKKEEIS